MNVLRKGYTLIEVIFVMVILGVMAAVLIPKLSENRNDAKAATIARELAVCINDAGTAYLKDGEFDEAIDGTACNRTININKCFNVDANNSLAELNISNKDDSIPCQKAQEITEKNGLSSDSGTIHIF